MKKITAYIGLMSIFATSHSVANNTGAITEEYLKENYVSCSTYNGLLDELVSLGILPISSVEQYKSCQWDLNPDMDYSVTFTNGHGSYSQVGLMLEIGEENPQIGQEYESFIQFWNTNGVGGTLDKTNEFVKEQSDEINRLLSAGKTPIVTMMKEGASGEADGNILGGEITASSYYQRDPVGLPQLYLTIRRTEEYSMPSSVHVSGNYYSYTEDYELTWED